MGPGQIPFVHVITSQECQTDDERAHARNKSSIFDVLNNEFDRAVKSFLAKLGLWTNWFVVVFALFNIKFNATVNLNLIIIARAKTSKQYAPTSAREFFLPSSKVSREREF